MNYARYNHSSCFMGETKLFVFGGMQDSNTYLDSIEFMDVQSGRPWLLLRIAHFG